VSETLWQRIARASAGERYAEAYAERFRRYAARGTDDVHGEATFVAGLVPPPARVLDAGCGTGRIAIRLAALGFDPVGVDVDESMLAQARTDAPTLDWRSGDLATLALDERFDLVVCAGNTLPLLEPGTLADACGRLAAHLAPEGRLVCGFGLDPAHLPRGCPVVPLSQVMAAMSAAGLVLLDEFSTWDGAPFETDGGYVVTVHTGEADR
jgi:SAM-dependent methyltransferase